MKMRLGLLAIVAMLLAMIAVACQTAQVSSQKLEVGSAHVRHSRQQNLAMAEAASVLDSVTGRPLLHKHMKLHKTTAIASIEATHVEVEEPIGGAAAVSAVTVADATGEPLAVSASPVFKTGPPSPEDCQQKTIADCYFVAAQKALCGEHPEEISALVKDVDAAHVGTIWWNGASWSAVLQGKAIPTYFGTPAASWPYLQEKSWCWARTGTNTYSSIANGSFTQVASKWGRSSSWYYENVGNAAHSDAQLSALIAANDTNGVPQVCLTLGQPNTSNNPPNLPANHFLWIRGLNSSGYALLSNPLSPPNTAPIVMSIATLRLNILCYEYSANRLYPIPATYED